MSDFPCLTDWLLYEDEDDEAVPDSCVDDGFPEELFPLAAEESSELEELDSELVSLF